MPFNVLVSAYACEPNKGSEQGIGWNVALELAKHCQVSVITRANNEPAITRALAGEDGPHPHFIYFDLPRWARFWKKGGRGVQLYYYLWQIGLYREIRRVKRAHNFDVVHHITFGRYWSPSLLWLSGARFVWGPIGGGESSPPAFWKGFSIRGKVYELSRAIMRRIGEMDPLVRRTARRSDVCLATTDETASCLRRMGARSVSVFPQVALPIREIEELSWLGEGPADVVRFITIGRLLHWKGVHLALEALSKVPRHEIEYWIIGDGPEKRRLERLAELLNVRNVRFWGSLPRQKALAKLEECHALIHPSLHDSGGWACLEAMAAGRPVVCLDTGAPPTLISERTGIKVPVRSQQAAVNGLADAIRRLSGDTSLREDLSRAARIHVAKHFRWPDQVYRLTEQVYRLDTSPG